MTSWHHFISTNLIWQGWSRELFMMWPGVLFYALEGLPSLKSWQMCQKYFWKLTFKFKRSKFWKEKKTFNKVEVVWWQQNMSFNCTWASTTKQSGRMFYFFIRGKTFQLHSFHYLKQAAITFQIFSPSNTRFTKIIICWMILERAEMDVTADVLCWLMLDSPPVHWPANNKLTGA